VSRLEKGKIIVIEGGDASGKQTQTDILIANLRALGVKIATFDFPAYKSATGKIVGGAFLGKPEICKSFFNEGTRNVDWRVASMYYAADRLYNLGEINNLLNDGVYVILDRYTYSNMAFQGGKNNDPESRATSYKWLEVLEYDLLGLSKPDLGIYLDVPVEVSLKLMKGRKKDGNEKDEKVLRMAKVAYGEIAEKYKLSVVQCTDKHGELRSREDIARQVLKIVADKFGIKLPFEEPEFFWNRF